MNKFEIISEKQFKKDFENRNVSYNDIVKPKRATSGSAGYDFFSPMDFCLNPGTTIKIPTGIKIHLDSNNVLLCFPRSSLGFKYKLKLDNTIGVIDSDYINAENEGHIWVSMTNMSSNNVLYINKGDKVFQGIIMNFIVTDDDNAEGIRTGGMGSTGK